MLLDDGFIEEIEIPRPQLPIIYPWMDSEFDTNSGFPLIGVEVTQDWMDIECPNCKNKYELTHDHLSFFSEKRNILYSMIGAVLILLLMFVVTEFLYFITT